MQLKRLNNIPFDAVKPNFVAIDVFFFNSHLVYQNNSLSSNRGETGSHLVSLRLLRGEQYLANHLRASKSVRVKNTLHLCCIY